MAGDSSSNDTTTTNDSLLPLSTQLTGYVDGTKPKPPPTISEGTITSPNPDYASWVAGDQRALILIQSSLSEEAIAETLSHSTSRDVWLALESTYRHDSRDAIIFCAESHEMFLQSVMDTPAAAPVAFNTTTSATSSRGRVTSNNRGFSSRGSYSRGRGRGNYHQRTPQCQWCRQNGHYATSCPDLHNVARSSSSTPTIDANLAAAFQAQCNTTPDWFVDTGASDHMTSHATQLDIATPYTGNDSVFFANGDNSYVSHIGKVTLSPNISLLVVLVVPKIKKNLLSVSKLTSDNPVDVLFSDPMFFIQNHRTKETLATGRRRNGLYVLERSQHAFLAKLSSKRLHASFDLWHNRLGFTWFYPLTAKSEFVSVFAAFIALVQTQFSCKIKTFQSGDATISVPSPTIPTASSAEPKSSTGMDSSTKTSSEPSVSNSSTAPTHVATLSTHPMQTRAKHARVVAQGFTQVPGIDYSATLSHVVKASIVRVILSLAVLNKWPLHQLDVKNAFLNGNLSEIVYMEKPPVELTPPYVVFKKASDILYLLVYVDDIILTGNNSAMVRQFISLLNKEFLITDLGKLSYFLGLEVSYHNSGIFLSQSKYAYDILTRARLLDAKPAATSLSTSNYLSSQGKPFHDPTQYRSLVGALQYVKGTLSYGLSFLHASSPNVLGYSDADWARCIETRRSTYGYSIFLGGNLVSWSAKKQPTVARSSCESKYRAMANTAAEILWLTHLLRELHVLPYGHPTLLCDNCSAIFLSRNPFSHKRAKHIDIDYHFVRELVLSGKLHTKYVSNNLQLADIFTKSLPRPLFEEFRSKLRVGSPPSALGGKQEEDNTGLFIKNSKKASVEQRCSKSNKPKVAASSGRADFDFRISKKEAEACDHIIADYTCSDAKQEEDNTGLFIKNSKKASVEQRCSKSNKPEVAASSGRADFDFRISKKEAEACDHIIADYTCSDA
ncbi:uncharacterized protein [Rutidosis leptorrhynchoides]|uniref:uncharacterized protein n=1 Tax=Rutidosis leptorrhynchoides TaxID=125765 RepID=UPI003A99F3CB